MLKEFNKLPLEIQSDVLQYNPYMRSLNKTFNESTKQYYYNNYCQLPISKKEFIKYVNLYHPSQFALFFNEDEDYKILVFTLSRNDFYELDTFTITIDPIDIDEYKIIYKYGQYYIQQFNNIISTFNHYFAHDIYYDLNLTKNIISERRCDQLNDHYISNYITNELNKHIYIKKYESDYKHIMNLLTNIVYMTMNLEFGFHPNTIEIIFDSMGNAIDGDDFDTTVDLLKKEYNQLYNYSKKIF